MKKYIRYWFSALPFRFALGLSVTYSIKKILKIPIHFYFSQTGEDVILSTLLSKEKGFYVDIGCNEPLDKSNTFIFYLKGWRGITVDADEGVISRHKKIRLYDKAICAAVSNTVKEVTFYKSKVNAVSTIAEDFYEKHKEHWDYTEAVTVSTLTLTSLLDQNLPPGTAIDLLTVDVEGIDFEVLQGLDFEKYRPRLIVVEDHEFSLEERKNNPIYQLLTYNRYRLQGFATMNAYFLDSDVSQNPE